MTKMKGITCCGDCGYYNWKKHKCTRATDEGDARSNFYADCPLPDVVPVQEPRVMKVGDVRKWVNSDRVTREPVVIEIRGGVCAWIIEDEVRELPGNANLSSDLYGKTWRVWTSRPSDEVRRATPWE